MALASIVRRDDPVFGFTLRASRNAVTRLPGKE